MRSLLLLPLVVTAVTAAEVSMHRWSGDLNVPDPVDCTVDEKGRVYVAATTRRKAADLDIREHRMWIADDVALNSVQEKREFLKRELAPGKLRAPRGGLKDHNKDGSIDWKDLTVHSERIYQLRDTNGDGTADKMTVFAEGFNTEVTGIAAGILYHDGWVYATIAPDLWRLKDTNDDGVADVREVVATGFGIHIAYAGHDMHGPRLGPDGRIYWSIGDKGLSVTDKTGRKWHYPHEGCVMRVEPDGSGFEVFAHGLRNVQEIAFDDFGNMFGVDNDADLPGERERVVYITEQSDSGWRCSHQYQKGSSRWMRAAIWQPQGEWKPGTTPVQPLFITPPLANWSNGPAGFVHEPGTALGPNLRGHFILNQFPSGRMEAFPMEQDGAAFKMGAPRLIHSGIMGIGLGWGPDGALYMADWQGGYPLDEKGAVWRVDEVGVKDMSARLEAQQILAAGLGGRKAGDLQKLLGHADQRVRLGAQLELVKKENWPALLAVVKDANAPLLARVHGLWGYGTGFRRGKVDDEALDALVQSEADPEMQAQLAKVLGEGKPSQFTVRHLMVWLKSASPRVRFHTVMALGRLKDGQAGIYLMDLVEKGAADPWMRHALVTALTGCMTPEELAERASAKSAATRLVCMLALARLRSPLIEAYLHDPDPGIVNEVARVIHDDEGIPELLRPLATLIEEERTWPDETLRRSLNANLRLGEPRQASRLLQYALRTPGGAGVTALRTLTIFAEPPRLDLVDGRARSFEARDAAVIVPSVVQPWMRDLLALKGSDMRAAVIELMIKLELKLDVGLLQGIIADTDASEALRIGALRLMGAHHSQDAAFPKVLTQAAHKSAPPALRMESLRQTVTHQADRAVGELSRVLEQGTLAEKQVAYKLLAALKSQEAAALLESSFQRLTEGRIEAGLKLDVLEAALASPALAKKAGELQQSRTSAVRDDLIEGGDPAAGREIVSNHLGANCLGCHTVEAGGGSEVGPHLQSIGAERTRAEILESLLNPAARIAAGYGLISVSLKDGSSIAGTLVAENPDTLEIRLADGTSQDITRSEIVVRTPPISLMPPMLGILTPREIRDVVAYLATLKARSEKAPALAKAKSVPVPSPKTSAKVDAKPAPAKEEPKPMAKAVPKPAEKKSEPKLAEKPAAKVEPMKVITVGNEPVNLAEVPKAIPMEMKDGVIMPQANVDAPQPEGSAGPTSADANRPKGLFNRLFGKRSSKSGTDPEPPAEEKMETIADAPPSTPPPAPVAAAKDKPKEEPKPEPPKAKIVAEPKPAADDAGKVTVKKLPEEKATIAPGTEAPPPMEPERKPKPRFFLFKPKPKSE